MRERDRKLRRKKTCNLTNRFPVERRCVVFVDHINQGRNDESLKASQEKNIGRGMERVRGMREERGRNWNQCHEKG